MEKLVIKEVSPRDGLQILKPVSLEVREQFVRKLMSAGIKHIEVGSFVNEKKVPQMAKTKELPALAAGEKSWINALLHRFIVICQHIPHSRRRHAGISGRIDVTTPAGCHKRPGTLHHEHHIIKLRKFFCKRDPF